MPEGDEAERWTFEYLEDRLVRELFQVPGAYVWERIYLWDGDRLIGKRLDRRYDGSIDSAEEYMYSPEGLLERVEYDSDGDGVVDIVEERQYDDGLLVSSVVDQEADGTIDERSAYEWSKDRRLIRRTIMASDGMVTSTFTWDYNVVGLITQRTYATSDGQLTYIERNEYDLRWRLSTQEADTTAGESAAPITSESVVYRFRYDHLDRPIEQLYEHSESRNNFAEHITYSCAP